MASSLARRTFLRGSVVTGGSLLSCTAIARKAGGQTVPGIAAPVIGKLVIRVIVDGAHDVFIPEQKAPDVGVAQTRPQRGEKFRRTLQAVGGYRYTLPLRRGQKAGSFAGFRYTSDVLNNNIELLEIDLTEVDGMILSHGHLDHWGGLPGFLQKHRASMRSDLPLYLGGEDALCRRVARSPGGAISPFGTLDRKELAAARLRLMVSEAPQVIDGHACLGAPRQHRGSRTAHRRRKDQVER